MRKTVIVSVAILVLVGLFWFFGGGRSENSPAVANDTSTEQLDGSVDANSEAEENQSNESNSTSVTSDVDNSGATVIPESDKIKVTRPVTGDDWHVGQNYVVQWSNYLGSENLTIALNPEIGSAKVIATGITAAREGEYSWVIGSEEPGKYKLDVYPEGGRNYLGSSGTFFISGSPLVSIESHISGSAVDASSEVVIKGSARNVYNEGEFDYRVTYSLDGVDTLITNGFATCMIGGQTCDWTSSDHIPFQATLDLASSPVCFVNVDFYARGKDESSLLRLPLRLYGINDCLK